MAAKTKVELNTETAIELLVSMRDNDQRNFDRLTASIEELTLNIGQLATQQKTTANNLDKLDERLDKLGDRLEQMITSINGHLSVAQMQSANISELPKLCSTQAIAITKLLERG